MKKVECPGCYGNRDGVFGRVDAGKAQRLEFFLKKGYMFKNVGSNWLFSLASIGSAYILLPFLVHSLGEQGYGIWTLIMSCTGYLALLILGVPMASVRYFAEYGAEEDTKEMNRAIGTCTGLYIMMGIMALIIGTALFMFFDSAYEIPAAWQRDARLAFGLVVFRVAVSFPAMIPVSVMAAYHEFVTRNLVLVGGVFLRLGLTLWLLSLEASLPVLAAIQIGGLAFEFSVLWLLIRRRHQGIRMNLSDFDWNMARRIISFSIYVLLLGMGSQLSFHTDSLVIGAFLEVRQISYYVIANSVVIYVIEVIVAIASVVMPKATELKVQGKFSQLAQVFLKWSKIAFSLSMMVGVFLTILGPRFIGWWIDPSFEDPAGKVLQILMLSMIVFLPARGVALATLMGLGKPKHSAVAFLVAGLVNVVLSVLLVRHFGLPGIALGTAIPNVLFGIVVVMLACRELGINLYEYIGYVIPKTIVGALPVLVLLLWLGVELEFRSFFELAGAGLLMVFVSIVIWVFFVYRDDPYVDLKGQIIRFVVWRKA